MILESLKVTVPEFERRSGWELRDEGACKGEVFIPLDPEVARDGQVNVPLIADRLGMPIVHDETQELWSLGPESGGRALTSANAPELVLPDVDGNPFDLRSLLGQKVLLIAWASW